MSPGVMTELPVERDAQNSGSKATGRSGKASPNHFFCSSAKRPLAFSLAMKSFRKASSAVLSLATAHAGIGFARDRLADLEHGGLLGDQRLQVDDGVDHVVDALERKILVGFRIGGVFDDLARACRRPSSSMVSSSGRRPSSALPAWTPQVLPLRSLIELMRRVALALHIVVRRVGDRAGEVERLACAPW